jgi:hypothetical protein
MIDFFKKFRYIVDKDKYLVIVNTKHYIVSKKKLEETITNALYQSWNSYFAFLAKYYLNIYDDVNNNFQIWDLFKVFLII